MRFTWIIVGFMMAACSGEPAEDDERSVLYDAAKTPLEKAEGVEATLLEAAEKRDEAIEESED